MAKRKRISRPSSRSSTIWARLTTCWTWPSTRGITSSMLSDGSCHGYYQGVIFAYGAYIYTLPGMSLLTSYEQAFGVRQLNWYMYPNNDFGFAYPYKNVITSTGTDRSEERR